MTTIPSELSFHSATGIDRIAPRTLYRIARLRQQIFVVEQECVYLDLDGRDLEPDTVQLWVEGPDGSVLSGLRILNEDEHEPGLRSIGRVVTDPLWRGRGLSAALLGTAIEHCAGHPVLIHAQSHLTSWYGRFGFAVCGEEFLEDGILHTPMRRG